MTGYALYRMPYAVQCTQLTGQVAAVDTYATLGSQQGFVMAPFAPSADSPILVISPDDVQTLAAGDAQLPPLPLPLLPHADSSDQRADYHIDFLNFHAQLRSGTFQKLVLSRTLDIHAPGGVRPEQLFRQACQRYPRMFVALVYTPQSGLWLVATPEILLSGRNSRWQTMALAGTMPWAEVVTWGDKNLQEQRYVASYIIRQLERFTTDFTERGPYTTRAGHLAHLRSDFLFTLYDDAHVGELLHALHPTPAVCGLPKDQARDFILRHEHHCRSYYSGFMGPLAVRNQTHLFVTLRCMQVYADGFRLYAGGGLLRDSLEEQEWQETEAKLDTMRRLIVNPEGATAP